MKLKIANILRNAADSIEAKKNTSKQPAGLTSLNSDHFFDKKHLVGDYFETHAEPHRYYPTSMEWPCYVIHIGRRLTPGIETNPRGELERFLQCSLQGKWSRRVPNSPKERKSPVYCLESITPDFIRRFSGYYPTLSGDKSDVQKNLGEVLAIDCCPLVDSQPPNLTELINASIELHREYITLTLFIPINLQIVHQVDSTGNARPAAAISKIGIAGVKLLCEDSATGTEDLLRLLYDTLPRQALNLPVTDYVDPAQVRLAELVRNFTEDWYHEKDAAAASSRGEGIFCVFHGAVLPSNWLRVWDLFPGFVEPFKVERWTPGQKAMEDTIAFLNRFWFLAKSSVYKTGLHDLVANFMRNGSVVYTSNIGAQASPDSKDYLRFLLVYRAPDLASRPAVLDNGPHDSDTSATDEKARAKYLVESYKIDEPFWISRIVSRLLTMGTLRLMAISDLGLINNAMLQLERIERELSEVESSATTDGEKYEFLNELIKEKMSRIWTGNYPLVARLSSNKIAFQSMKRQLEDLEILRIPGWQSYDAFINRRLVTTYERISEISDRYDDIWRVIRSRMEVIETGSTLRLTRIARDVGFAALAATLTPVVEPFAANLWNCIWGWCSNILYQADAYLFVQMVNGIMQFVTAQIFVFVSILGLIYSANSVFGRFLRRARA